MLRVRVSSTGWLGAPGLSTYYYEGPAVDAAEAAVVAGRVRAAYAGMVIQWPTTIKFQVLPQVDVVDPSTGDVTDSFIIATPALVTGTFPTAGLLPPQVAVLMKWGTSSFLAGRRVAGRTFLTQVRVGNMGPDGEPTAGCLSAYADFGVAIVDVPETASRFSVWRRPRAADASATPPVAARAGSVHEVTSTSVSPRFATLNSRRDV